MHLLGISGSLRAASTSTQLLQEVLHLASPSDTWTLYDGLADLPAFSPDLDGTAPPAPVGALRTLLRAADAVIISTPEYAHGLPGSLKNLLDWHVGSGEFVDKPVAALSAGPGETGGFRAHASLLTTLAAMNAILLPETALVVPFVRQRVSAAGLIDPDLTTAFRRLLASLRNA